MYPKIINFCLSEVFSPTKTRPKTKDGQLRQAHRPGGTLTQVVKLMTYVVWLGT